MSEVIEYINELQKQFKVTIRPKSLQEYKNYALKLKMTILSTGIKEPAIYIYHFTKEKFPYLTCKDMADIMNLSMSNYSKKKEKWIFEIKTYDDVKQNIKEIKSLLNG